MQMRKFLIVGLILLTATVGFAQATKVRGKVLDSSGLIMPGATVKIYQGNKLVQEGTTSNTGDFELSVAAGNYKIEVSAPDFATKTQDVKVAANLAPLTFKLDLAVLATNVDVTDDAVAVSVDSDSSLSTTTRSTLLPLRIQSAWPETGMAMRCRSRLNAQPRSALRRS